MTARDCKDWQREETKTGKFTKQEADKGSEDKKDTE